MPEEDGLRSLLETLAPKTREALRRVLILDEPDHDAIATELIHYGDEAGFDWADILDFLTMHPDLRRRGCGSSGRLKRASVPIG